jgi:hypothetical protein
MYEYSSMNWALDFEPDFLNSVDQKSLGAGITNEISKMISEFCKANPKQKKGNWEIVSHSLLPLRDRLVISLLLRRPL